MPAKALNHFSPLTSAPVRYALPFAGILLALTLQWTLSLIVPVRIDFPYAFFYLVAIFAAAWFGGYVPGAIACLITMVGVPLVAVRGFQLSKVDPSRLVLLIGLSLAVSLVAQAQKRRR